MDLLLLGGNIMEGFGQDFQAYHSRLKLRKYSSFSNDVTIHNLIHDLLIYYNCVSKCVCSFQNNLNQSSII